MKKAGFAIAAAGAWIAAGSADAWCIPGAITGLALTLAGAMLMGTGMALQGLREEEARRTEEHRERVWQTWIRM